jgi:hypothetical protein
MDENGTEGFLCSTLRRSSPAHFLCQHLLFPYSLITLNARAPVILVNGHAALVSLLPLRIQAIKDIKLRSGGLVNVE